MTQVNPSKAFADFPPPGFKGIVVRPGDPGYDKARELPNSRYAMRQPALIARCFDANDIEIAVNYCTARGESIAIRGGGHAIDGHAMPHGAFVIDTSPMKRITIDPETGITTVEAGALLGEMDAVTQEHGYVVPSGTVSKTGVAGLTLGGGMGYLTRRFGMTVDNLLSVDVVTVDGRRVTASEIENPDLFWGLRGAGHNLAVATSFTYQAHKVGPNVISGLIAYPIEAALPVLSGIDEIMLTASRDLTLYPVILPAPPLPGLSEQIIGAPIFVLLVVFIGDIAQYEQAMAGVRPLAQPLVDGVHLSTWIETNSLLDMFAPPGRRQHNRAGYLAAIKPEIARIAVDLVSNAPTPTGPGPSVAIAFPCLGGACLDFDEDSAVFSRQGAYWLWEAFGQWDPPEKDTEYMGWVDGVMDALNPHSLRTGYVNLSTDRGPEWLRNLYGSLKKWERICALKAEFDPQNLLSYNKNIARAQAAAAVLGATSLRESER